MTAHLLEVDGLSVEFGTGRSTVHAVRDVSWHVDAGETLAVVGESGSGKTVTAQAVTGILDCPPARVTAGAVRFRGEDLLTATARTRRRLRGTRIALVTQDSLSALNPVASVGAQIAEMFSVHLGLGRRESRRRAVAALERVGIADAAKRARAYPHEFSGGMRQRVVIAMATCLDPAVLIADEPTTALDVTVQAHVVDLLLDLCRTAGTALVVITHDLPLAASFADRIAVMRRGEVVEQGVTAEVLDRPRHPYTAALVAAVTPDPVDAPDAAPTSDAPPLLAAEGVTRRYRSRGPGGGPPHEAVRGVDLHLDRDETLGLVGGSGSGKSTLARLLTGIEAPDAGRVLFDGRDLAALGRTERRRFRRRVQMVFQDPYASLNPVKDVSRIVGEPWLVHPDVVAPRDRDRVTAELLDAVGLAASLARRFPDELSGGQRQRVGIARALALRPEVLVCDEPVSSLDLTVQAQVLDLLRDLRERYHLAYVVISHDLSVVRRVSDRVAVMHRGEIVETGPADDVFARPAHAYTRALLAAAPPWPPDGVTAHRP